MLSYPDTAYVQFKNKGNVKTGDTAAVTKPAPPLAIDQEQSGITLDDLIGKQPELVGREGV